MKTTFLIAAALTLVSVDAYAATRYDVQAMSCEHAQSVVNSQGAAILRYSSPRGLPLYDRYVAGAGFCNSGEYARSAWVPTSDTASCPVLICEPKSFQRQAGRHN